MALEENPGVDSDASVSQVLLAESGPNLKVERFYTPRMINGRMASADGPIKTFPLRGIKDSPPYLHDDRLLTLEDTVEFFNLMLDLKLEVGRVTA